MAALVDGEGVDRVVAERDGFERVDQRARARHLRQQGGQELALVLYAFEVAGGELAAAHVAERLRAVEFLTAGWEVQSGVAVVDGLVDADLTPPTASTMFANPPKPISA